LSQSRGISGETAWEETQRPCALASGEARAVFDVTTGASNNPEAIAASLQESEDLLALAQEAGGFGIFEWHVQNGTVRLSPKLLTLYGLGHFDGRYETWLGYVFREDVLRIRNDIQEAFAMHRTAIVEEFRIVRADDQTLRWMERRGTIFYDRQDRPERLLSVSVDVTEWKRATVQLRAFAETLEENVKARTRELEAENQARRKAEESLRQSQKMEAVGQLTGGVAHDFNNLLTIVLGGLEIIERQIPELPASPAARRIGHAREMAVKGAHRAVLLTQRLLAFSRQQPLSPQSIDPNRLVSGISDLLRRTIGEAISLESVLAGGIWNAHADPNQLENALVNLAVNARDAMPDGGKLTIETENCYLDEAYVGSLAEPVRPGQYIMIAVADSGVGMDAVTIERAFEPFFTTKEVGKGTGLGLSQVYGFVRQSAGHVRIYSEAGQGTTVKIYLPRYFGIDKEADIAVPTRDSPRAMGNECILVVEDDDALRAYTVEILGELGYYVLEAQTGPQALRLLEPPQQVDLLFTDIVMPGGMNGRQLADAAVLRRPDLKVLFTTGYTRNAIIHHGRLDPGVQMISKPFSMDALASKVRDILDSSDG
jgi:signal transduction histidine kinase/CheY-like chemotaxis protein